MKSVIFICLLSLSACLSDQSLSQDATPMSQDQANKVPVDSKAQTTEEQSPPKNSNEAVSNVTSQNAGASPTTLSTPVQSISLNESTPVQANSSLTTTITNDIKQNTIKADNNQTDNKLPETKEKEAKPTNGMKDTTNASKNETASEPTGKIEKNTTIINDKGKNDTNTTKNEIVKPTEAPTLQTRSFDGPSFIGGIILTLGLIAVSFIGYKYYKNQTERNYYGTL